MHEYTESYEKEISLAELFFYCLNRWRWIICFMIIVALVAGGYKYLTVTKSNQSKLQERQLLEERGELEPEMVIENPNVKYYEQAIDKTEQELEKQEAYLEDSVIMQLDAYQLPVGVLTFCLDLEKEQEYDLNNLIAAYRAYVMDGRLAEQLFTEDSNISVAELQYLLSFNNGENLSSEVLIDGPGQKIFQIQIAAPDQETCKAYLEIIEKAVKDYSSQLQQEIEEHTLRLLAAAQSEQVSEKIQQYQASVRLSYKTLLDQQKNLKDNLETVREKEGETVTIGQAFVLNSPLTEALKYVIAGLVLGAFLTIFVLILSYVMSGKLQSTEMFQEQFNMKVLGEIRSVAKEKRFLGFIDNWIYRLKERAYANIPQNEHMKIVVANLKGVMAQKEGLKKVMLAGTIAEKDVSEFCHYLIEGVEEVSFSPYKQIVFDAMALEELDDYDAVIFLEEKGVSYSKLIKQEQRLAAERHIEVLGAVVI